MMTFQLNNRVYICLYRNPLRNNVNNMLKLLVLKFIKY